MGSLQTASLLILGSMVASAQGAPAEQRVRVLGNVMAGQVVTKVAPVYPATAKERGVSGEVVLYAAVGADGRVEQVAFVRGQQALQNAAMDAVKQWQYKPYLVNGQAVEVDTTVTVDFQSGIRSASSPSLPTPSKMVLSGSGGSSSGTSAVQVFSRQAGPVAAAPAPVSVPSAAKTPVLVASATRPRPISRPIPGTIDWDSDRRMGEQPAAAAHAAAPVTASPYAPTVTGGAAASSSPALSSLPVNTNGAVAPVASDGHTQWNLVRKVAPVYPADASASGVEGVVLVDALVRKNGTVKPLEAVSGPPQLRQAAMDAVSQYQYAPSSWSGKVSEARTEVTVEFMLRGAATVEPEVMAGYLEQSYAPSYPAPALAAGVYGSVTLHVLIGRDGLVETVSAVSGPDMLRQSAIDAVKKWKYRSYLRAGVHSEVETDVLLRFTLPRR